MPAGIGGGGYVIIALEATNGTLVAPDDAGAVAVPILNESLKYTSDPYVSPQLRLQTIGSDVKQGYYHAEGDIEMEVDPRFLPYFLHCTRHTIAKVAGPPVEYTYAPSSAGAASDVYKRQVQRTMSIHVSRNNEMFGYAGCTMGGMEFALDTDEGVLKVTFNVLGLSEAESANAGTPTFVAPDLFGADAHQVFVAASAVTPTFGAASIDYNGFTFRTDFNAEPQNRIRLDRSASYISFGETIANIETELDFIDRTEYDNFKNTTQRAVRLLSANGGTTFAAATSAVQITANRMFYETYDLGLEGIGDLIMAGVTGRLIGIAGGDAYKIQVKSPTNIA